MAILPVQTITAVPVFIGTTGTVVPLTGLTLQPGDLLVVNMVCGRAAGNVGAWACTGDGNGTTTQVSDNFSSDTDICNQAVFLRRQGSTVDANLTVSDDDTGNRAYAIIISQYRGVDLTTPLDVAAVNATGINSDLPDPAAITPATTGALIVICYAGSQATITAWAAPTGVSDFNQAGSNRANAATGDKPWTGGAYNPAALTGGDSAGRTSNSWTATTLALRPAAGGNIKVWTGSAWVAKPVKVWNGSAWVIKPLKRWNGSAWVKTTY